MPFNPGGVFSLIASYFAQPGSTIRTEQHNPPLEDIASSLSLVLIRDGRAPMIGPLNMNGNEINNIAPGTTSSSVATLAQAMPIGAVIDFAGPVAPAGWMLCYGQAISRTAYAALFAITGTQYGAGDGNTTFNLPDARGSVVAGCDNMGGTAAGRLTTSGSGINGSVLGANGGAQAVALSASQVAPHTHSGTTGAMTRNASHTHFSVSARYRNAQVQQGASYLNAWYDSLDGNSLSATSGTDISHEHPITTNTGDGVTGAAHNNMPPTLVLNKIIRVSYNG